MVDAWYACNLEYSETFKIFAVLYKTFFFNMYLIQLVHWQMVC